VIITGKETEFLINDMRELFQKVNESFGSVLQAWDGDENKVKGIKDILANLIMSGKYDGVYYEKDDPKARRDLLFKNISLGLTRSTKEVPVLLCIEDLQWADPSSLALLQYIARNTRNFGLLTIGTFRPEEIAIEGKSHPLTETLQMMDREDLYTRIQLQRLPEDSINEFLSSQLGKNEFNDEFKNRIYSETDGNPLFIIQLIKYLVEEEVVINDDGIWKLDKELEEINIPTKIYNVIARRLDKLEKADRKVLDYSSVIGPMFTSNVLSHSLGVERIPLLEQLRALEKTHKLIYSFDGNFKFDHDKIKEVLYNEIPPELRMEYHSIIANSIEVLNKDNLSDVVGDLAFHYYRCKNKDKALQYLAEAAAEAKKHYSNEESIRFYTQALEFEQEPQKRTAILESLGDIYYLIRNYDLSIDSYNSALVLTEGRKKAEMMAKIGGILERKGEFDGSLEICSGALELVKGTWTTEEALALQNIGNVYLSKKDYDKALEEYEKSLEIRQKINDELGIGACLNNIALVHYGKEEYDSALEYLEKSLEIAKKLGDQESMASTLNNIGAIHQMKGDLAKAKIYYDRSQSIRAKIAAYIEVPPAPAPPGTTQIIRGGYPTP
jgi:predicted ATPase